MNRFSEVCQLLVIGAGVSSMMSCQATKPSSALAPPAAADCFEKTIRPMLEHRCIQCHHDKMPSAGLNFQDRTGLFAKNDPGPFLDPGSPETSRIYRAISKPKTHPGAMPGDGWGIAAADVNAFRTWIQAGAPWPEGPGGQLKVKEYQVKLDDYP